MDLTLDQFEMFVEYARREQEYRASLFASPICETMINLFKKAKWVK